MYEYKQVYIYLSTKTTKYIPDLIINYISTIKYIYITLKVLLTLLQNFDKIGVKLSLTCIQIYLVLE